MTTHAAILTAVMVGVAAPARAIAQSLTTETSVTVGRSTEAVNEAAAQVRAFGTIKADWRFFAEGSWGLVSGPESDAFGAAYPYDRRLRPMDAYLEKTLHPAGWLLGMRAGHYRTPFGISGRGDFAYAGFIRPPLIRYGDNGAISNTFFETGASVIAGRPSLYLEASAGVPGDVGEDHRRAGFDTVARAQAYFHSVIVGVSYLRTLPAMPVTTVTGRMVFAGADVRVSRGGVQLRGEWIAGRPFDYVSTRGGYVDLIAHRPSMGPVSLVARIERVDYDAGALSMHPRRVTAGARLRLNEMFSVELNAVRQPGGLTNGRVVAFDCGLTYTRRF